MYGALRFLYDNLITDYSMLTLSSQTVGRKSGIAKDGEGVATLNVAGNFAGGFDLSYFLEIDSISGGQEVGTSTFKWRTSDTAEGDWEETSVLTRTSPAYALSSDGLGTGLSVAHVGGTGDDFELGDDWQWKCSAKYGAERLLDRNRMTQWRTTNDTSENCVIDLGSAQAVTAAILHDHNLTTGATVKLQGHTSDSWGAPTYDYTFSTITDPLIVYPSGQTLRYWRWLLEDASNPDGYIEVANIFAGTYLELDHIHANWGAQDRPGYTLQQNRSEAGTQRRYVYAAQRVLELGFGQTLSNTDVDSLITVQEDLVDTGSNIANPLWVHMFSDVDATLRLMDWDNFHAWTRAYSTYLLNSRVVLRFSEVVSV